MGSPRKPTSPLQELAPWVVLLIVGLNASRMAANGSIPQSIVLVAFATVAGASGGLYVLERYLHQLTCPACRKLTLRRLLRHPRFFRCLGCVQRVRRDAKGGWQDARAPQFDEVYRPRGGTWIDAPSPDADDSTCGTLLGRKFERASLLEAWQRGQEAGFDPESQQTVAAFRKASAYLGRLPWSRPRRSPVVPGKPPAPGESTWGVLLRNQHRRRGTPAGGQAPAPAPPWDRDLDA